MPTAAKIEWPQGQPLFEVQWRAVAESLAGNGVQGSSDLEVTATSNPLEIEVASGSAYYLASEATLSNAETHTLSSGDGSNDRWDTVYFDTSSASSGVREGSAETNPEPPDVQGDELLLAVVYVPSGASDVPDENVLNWRAQFSNEAEEVHYDDSTGTYNVSSVAGALDELADLSSSTITVSAGTGIGTTNEEIALNGSATLSVDQAFSPTWTGQHTFDSYTTLQQVSTPSAPSSGYNQLYPKSDGYIYSQDNSGTERRIGGDVKTASTASDYTTQGENVLFVDPSGTGGVTISLATADNYDGHGITVIDSGQAAKENPITITTEGSETIDESSSKEISTNSAQLILKSNGTNWFTSGGIAAVGVNPEEFNSSESGTVVAGNSGIVYVTQVESGRTLNVHQAGLILEDGQAAPTNLDLVIATLDNSGAASKQADIVVGDGTIKSDQKGEPLTSYENTGSSEETIAILIDNGNFNSGTGSDQGVFATVHGEVF